MSTRDSLAGIHRRLAASHRKQSELFAKADAVFGSLRECLGAMDKADLSDADEHLDNYADVHKALAEHHSSEADWHTARAGELADATKAAGLHLDSERGDMSKLVPLEGLRIIPVPRHGQQPIESRDGIPAEFVKVLGLDQFD